MALVGHSGSSPPKKARGLVTTPLSGVSSAPGRACLPPHQPCPLALQGRGALVRLTELQAGPRALAGHSALTHSSEQHSISFPSKVPLSP